MVYSSESTKRAESKAILNCRSTYQVAFTRGYYTLSFIRDEEVEKESIVGQRKYYTDPRRSNTVRP
jgi:hypothetical protein